MDGADEMADPDVVGPLLRRWADERYPGPVRVLRLRRLAGHSGITWGFAVESDVDGPDELVVKLRPARANANAGNDIVGQGRMLAAMAARGVRVPAVRAVGADGPFPVPFLVTELVRGSTLGDAFDASQPPCAGSAEIESCFRAAVAELRRIHAIVPDPELERVFRRRDPADEVRHWLPVLHKAQDPEWVESGTRLHDRLLDTVPEDPGLGVGHGDFYANNWLFDGGELTAVLDWESASLGPTAADLGWLCMIYDRASWGPSRRPMLAPFPEPGLLVDAYTGDGPPVPRLGWFRALAAFKLAGLTAHFLRLHRTGRRPDPSWEVFGEAFAHLVRRAGDLLDDERGDR